jgi:hypothetical protein
LLILLDNFFQNIKSKLDAAQKSFSLPECVSDKSKVCFRRLQNSPSAQTVVITDLDFILSPSKDFAKTGGATRRVAQYILIDLLCREGRRPSIICQNAFNLIT